MNLILFEPDEVTRPLSRTDPRAEHILQVLRRAPGDMFDAGIVEGPRGKATLVAVTPTVLEFAFHATTPPLPAPDLHLLLGFPRPQTARKVLQEATTLGVRALHFVATEKSEASYAQSTLWSSGEWRRHAIAGAEQAFRTRLPEITWTGTLADALTALPPLSVGERRIGLDNYESALRLRESVVSSQLHASSPPTIRLAIGPERGWHARDRALLRDHHFVLHHLGSRVLRTETAVVSALAILSAAFEWE